MRGHVADQQQPAGWYPSPEPELSGRFARYWDGARWTNHQVELHDALTSPVVEPTTEPAAFPPEPSGDAGEPTLSGPPAPRRFIWLARLAIAVIFALLMSLFVVERVDASGPLGYSLANETTNVNPLANRPRLRLTSGEVTREFPIAQTAGRLSQVGGISWSLDEPLIVEFIPAFEAEESHRVVVDLRRDGASALNAGWFVRVDVVATNGSFEIEISQPVASGLFRSRQVSHRISLPRSNERMLIAALEAEQEREAERRRVADEARREVQRAKAECEREESATRRAAVAPITGLQGLLQESLNRRGIYGTGTITFDDYRRRINNLTSDMQAHLNTAERALSEPQPATGEFERVIRDYSALRQAWVDFERALRSPRPGRQRTFKDLYPIESDAIERLEERVRDAALAASSASSRVITSEVRGLCESRHPLP